MLRIALLASMAVGSVQGTCDPVVCEEGEMTCPGYHGEDECHQSVGNKIPNQFICRPRICSDLNHLMLISDKRGA